MALSLYWLKNVLYLHPLQQGLKLQYYVANEISKQCSLLTSITTRIETEHLRKSVFLVSYVLYLHPLQQGLKPFPSGARIYFCHRSLLTSITTRIETHKEYRIWFWWKRFFTYIHYNKDWNIFSSIYVFCFCIVLYLHPLQQGLKQRIISAFSTRTPVLYLHPLQQGLKLSLLSFLSLQNQVLYLHPLQQGLKPSSLDNPVALAHSSLLTSITTRIETFTLSRTHALL